MRRESIMFHISNLKIVKGSISILQRKKNTNLKGAGYEKEGPRAKRRAGSRQMQALGKVDKQCSLVQSGEGYTGLHSWGPGNPHWAPKLLRAACGKQDNRGGTFQCIHKEHRFEGNLRERQNKDIKNLDGKGHMALSLE